MSIHNNRLEAYPHILEERIGLKIVPSCSSVNQSFPIDIEKKVERCSKLLNVISHHCPLRQAQSQKIRKSRISSDEEKIALIKNIKVVSQFKNLGNYPLPQEIFFYEIISWLSIKDLFQLKCTSQTLNQLIDENLLIKYFSKENLDIEVLIQKKAPLKIIQLAIKAGANLEANILFHAIRQKASLEVIQLFLKSCNKLNLWSEEIPTCLYSEVSCLLSVAIKYGAPSEVLTLLLEAGATGDLVCLFDLAAKQKADIKALDVLFHWYTKENTGRSKIEDLKWAIKWGSSETVHMILNSIQTTPQIYAYMLRLINNWKSGNIDAKKQQLLQQWIQNTKFENKSKCHIV